MGRAGCGVGYVCAGARLGSEVQFLKAATPEEAGRLFSAPEINSFHVF